MAEESEEKKAGAQASAETTGGQGAEMPPLPEYELSSYEPVEFEMPKLEVDDAVVDQKIHEYLEQYGTEYVPTDRKIVGAHDDVRIDVFVMKGSEEIPALTSDNRLFTLGEGLMPEQFEKNVLGMKVGETREFDFDAPDFDAPDGAETTFRASVTVNKIMRKTIPLLTDGWVRKYQPAFKDAQGFRAHIEQELHAQAGAMYEQEKNQRAVHALSERFSGHIDDAFYEQMRAQLQMGYAQQAQAQGMSMQDFIKAQGMDENTFSMMLMMQTREMLVQGFCLDAWARHFGLEVSDADLHQFAAMMVPAGRADEFLKRLEESPEEKESFTQSALRYVANRDLVAKAKISYVDASGAPAAPDGQ